MDRIASLIERVLFASRWLLVPLYLGLAVFLLLIAAQFFREMLHVVGTMPTLGGTDLILLALSLVDLVLVASLIVMVMLSGYENFVSKLDIAATQRNLAWLGKLAQAQGRRLDRRHLLDTPPRRLHGGRDRAERQADRARHHASYLRRLGVAADRHGPAGRRA